MQFIFIHALHTSSRMNLIDNFSSYHESCEIESFQNFVNWRLGRVLKQEAEKRAQLGTRKKMLSFIQCIKNYVFSQSSSIFSTFLLGPSTLIKFWSDLVITRFLLTGNKVIVEFVCLSSDFVKISVFLKTSFLTKLTFELLGIAH